MSIVVKPYTFSAGATIIAAEHNSNFDTLYSDYNGNITNANLSASAAIALSKISFTTALTMSGAITNWAKGADVASAAGTITLGNDGNYFDITGTAAITGITAKAAGTVVMLQTDSTASLVDGSNLKIAGNFQGAAESTIMLVSDGTNWFEISRSPISSPIAASQADQETGTSTTTYVSPGRQQYHVSACKAWVNFNGTGTPGVVAGYNVSSITDNGTGDYTVNLTTSFSTANYAVILTASEGAGTQGVEAMLYPTTPLATGSFRISILTGNGNARFDTPTICAAAFGDQ